MEEKTKEFIAFLDAMQVKYSEIFLEKTSRECFMTFNGYKLRYPPSRKIPNDIVNEIVAKHREIFGEQSDFQTVF